MWTTSNGYIKNAFNLFFINLCLYRIFELSWAPLAFCRSCSVFRAPSKTKNSSFVDCWMIQHCWGGFSWKAKSLFRLFGVFLLVWFGFGVFLGFLVGTLPCSLFILSGDLGGSWELARTSVGSPESIWHRSTFSSFELCLTFCLKKIIKVS